jgi:hypothetical protein
MAALLAGAKQSTTDQATAVGSRRSIDELIRVVNGAQERDAGDERRLYEPKLGERSPSFRGRRAK